MRAIIAIFLAMAIAGCATHAPAPSHAPPPAVDTEALGQSIAKARTATASAKTRIVTVTQQVDHIIKEVDPVAAAELQEVQAELFQVNVDLQTALESGSNSEAQRVVFQNQAINIREYALQQQKLADANGEGWRKSELALSAQKVLTAKATSRGNKAVWIISIAVTVLGASLASHLLWLVPPEYRAAGVFVLPIVGGAIGFASTWLISWFAL